MSESSLNAALRQFEAVESNLCKAEKVLNRIEGLTPSGITFGDDPEYDELCAAFKVLYESLPKIDGWKPDIELMSLNDIGMLRFQAMELGDFEYKIQAEQEVDKPGRLIREYRFRFDQKRRALIRESLVKLIEKVDEDLQELKELLIEEGTSEESVSSAKFEQVKDSVGQIQTLIGSSLPELPRWGDLQRHLFFGLYKDLRDIIELDWPSVRSGLWKSIFGERDPMPVNTEDLGLLAEQKPRGPVVTKLMWSNLTAEEFERLVYALIISTECYENPQWLTKTNAPDRGRDLSAHRVHKDPLSGARRDRVIIQCRHWLTRSINPAAIAELKEQLKLWEPPRVDVCIIATSGTFTSDAVRLVESHNQSDSALHIEVWPHSHLEFLLASRPWLIADFKLR